MRPLLLIAVVLLAGCTDKGICLKKHYESSGYFQPIYTTSCNGSTCQSNFAGMSYVDTSGDVCDEWQYPNGKPK